MVAALAAEPAKLLEHPDQRQPLACRSGLIIRQHSVEIAVPGSQLRPQLHQQWRINLEFKSILKPSSLSSPHMAGTMTADAIAFLLTGAMAAVYFAVVIAVGIWLQR